MRQIEFPHHLSFFAFSFSWPYLHGPRILNNFLSKSVTFPSLFSGILVTFFFLFFLFPISKIMVKALSSNISISIYKCHKKRKSMPIRKGKYGRRGYRKASRKEEREKPCWNVCAALATHAHTRQRENDDYTSTYSHFCKNVACSLRTFFIQNAS